jgi:hypothetical protein
MQSFELEFEIKIVMKWIEGVLGLFSLFRFFVCLVLGADKKGIPGTPAPV